MSLSSMYMDTPTTEISGTIANLRKEEADKKARNWKSAQDLLRGAAVDSIRGKYADQIDWEQGVQNADKVFKVQYERLMAVDPQAAAQLAQEYNVEREKRINKEVAAAYKTSDVDQSLKTMEDEIAALSASIQSDEIKAQQSEAAAQHMQGYLPEGATGVGKKADPAAYAAQADAEEQMQGYAPAPTGLRSFYGDFSSPAAPAQQPLHSPRSGVRTPQSEAEAYGMTGYRPLSAMYGGR